MEIWQASIYWSTILVVRLLSRDFPTHSETRPVVQLPPLVIRLLSRGCLSRSGAQSVVRLPPPVDLSMLYQTAKFFQLQNAFRSPSGLWIARFLSQTSIIFRDARNGNILIFKFSIHKTQKANDALIMKRRLTERKVKILLSVLHGASELQTK